MKKIDENWKSEISHVGNNVAKSIGIISRYSFFLPKTSLHNYALLFLNLSLFLLLQYIQSLGFVL